MRSLSLVALLLTACSVDGVGVTDAGPGSPDRSMLLSDDDLAIREGGAPAHCADGQRDLDETDVDCGGSCGPCGDGLRCLGDGDCLHALCIGETCRPGPTCADGRTDGTESDVDCGGDCAPCPLFHACRANADCASRLCGRNICVPPVARQLAFDAPVVYPVAGGPGGVTVTDFDGDGHLDVATTLIKANAVGVLPGKPGGILGAVITVPAGTEPTSIATGDLDDDFHPDLVTGNAGSKDVSVLLWRAGSFAKAVAYPTLDAPKAVKVGDVDGDLRLDLVVSTLTVVELPALGRGKFGPLINYFVAGGGEDIVLFDFNGDLRADVVVPYGSVKVVQFAPGIPGGGQPVQTWMHSLGVEDPQDVTAGDYDGDGRLDFAVRGRMELEPYLATGPGTFRNGPAQNVTVNGGLHYATVSADLNVDGWVDVATIGDFQNNLLIFLGRGDGTFEQPVKLQVDTWAYDLAAADLDADGKRDLILSVNDGQNFKQNVTVLFNRSH